LARVAVQQGINQMLDVHNVDEAILEWKSHLRLAAKTISELEMERERLLQQQELQRWWQSDSHQSPCTQ
jgi:hypothetical protein